MTSRCEPLVVLAPTGAHGAERGIAVEAPVAVEVNGFGYAVMMATPADLPVFVTGFLLTERLADTAGDIIDVAVAEVPDGWIARATVAQRCAHRIDDRVRHRASDTGCGLCGISGLEQLRRPAPRVAAPAVTAHALFRAQASLRDHQPLNARTGAVHAAAWCDPDGGIVQAFEDVGRHNALDKLVGARALAGVAPNGFVLVSSRVSFEMVDKALVARAPLLVGISAPTTMAIDHARAHGLTLVALARADTMLVLNDPAGIFAVVAEEGLEPPTPGL